VASIPRLRLAPLAVCERRLSVVQLRLALACPPAGVNTPRSARRKLVQFRLDVVDSAASTALLSSHIVTGIQDATIGWPFGAPAIGS
jgi:hypothetical protein